MSLFTTLKAITDTARASVSTVVEAALGQDTLEGADTRIAWWARQLVDGAGIDLTVLGLEHAGEGNEPFIVMSNHRSLYDIPVLFCAVPGRLRMVAKAELFRVPIWGRAMDVAGFIRVDRTDNRQAVQSLRNGSRLLTQGVRVWIAPEGTRSRSGKLGPFKSGGFRMAIDNNVRILPTVLRGTEAILEPDGRIVNKGGRVSVQFLPPIDPQAYGLARRKELSDHVRQEMQRALDE